MKIVKTYQCNILGNTKVPFLNRVQSANRREVIAGHNRRWTISQVKQTVCGLNIGGHFISAQFEEFVFPLNPIALKAPSVSLDTFDGSHQARLVGDHANSAVTMSNEVIDETLYRVGILNTDLIKFCTDKPVEQNAGN